MSGTKPPHPPPPHPPPCLAILYFYFKYRKRMGNLKELPSPTFRGGGVCKGHIKNCSGMMFPESKTVFKKTSHFMHKNRENGRKSL